MVLLLPDVSLLPFSPSQKLSIANQNATYLIRDQCCHLALCSHLMSYDSLFFQVTLQYIAPMVLIFYLTLMYKTMGGESWSGFWLGGSESGAQASAESGESVMILFNLHLPTSRGCIIFCESSVPSFFVRLEARGLFIQVSFFWKALSLNK